MQWDGNPSIILAIKTLLGLSLPVQVIYKLMPSHFYSLEAFFNVQKLVSFLQNDNLYYVFLLSMN